MLLFVGGRQTSPGGGIGYFGPLDMLIGFGHGNKGDGITPSQYL
jgi:hypothetical protein